LQKNWKLPSYCKVFTNHKVCNEEHHAEVRAGPIDEKGKKLKSVEHKVSYYIFKA